MRQPLLSPQQQPSVNEGAMNLVRVGMVVLYVSLLIASVVKNFQIITPDPEKYNAGCYPGGKYKDILGCTQTVTKGPSFCSSQTESGSQTEIGSRCVYKPTTQEELVVSYYNLIARPTTREFVDQDVCWLALSASIVSVILAVITFGRYVSKNIFQEKLPFVMILHTILVAFLPLLTWFIPWRLVPIPLDDDGEIDDLKFDDHIAYLPAHRQQRFWLFFITTLLILGLMRAMSKFEQVNTGITSAKESIRSLGSRGYQQMKGIRSGMSRMSGIPGMSR